MHKLRSTLAVLGSTALITLGLATPALATNQGTVSGYSDAGACTPEGFTWEAETIFSPKIENLPPNLRVDVNGQPADWTNAGYVKEVSTGLGDPGIFELQHFFPGGDTTMAWRIPVATDHTINNAKVTFFPPADLPAGSTISFDGVSTNAIMGDPTRFGPQYANYEWSNVPQDAAVQNPDGSWTVNLGTIPQGQAHIFQFDIQLPASEAGWSQSDKTYTGTATLDGNYIAGPGEPCEETTPPAPTPGECVECRIQFQGQSEIKPDGSGPFRTKYWQGEVDTVPNGTYGEVNADGWGGLGSANDPYTVRSFITSRVDQENVTYTIKAEQGATFRQGSVGGISTPGAGHALNISPFGTPVEGAHEPVISEDGKTMTIFIEKMPAYSSLSWNVNIDPDGSGQSIWLSQDSKGTLSDCIHYSKSVDKQQTKAGEELTYTLTFDNPQDTPSEVAFRDNLAGVLDDATLDPETITVDGFTTEGGAAAATATLQGTDLMINGTVAPNSTATVTYTVQVNGKGDKSLNNDLQPQQDHWYTNCDEQNVTVTPVVDDTPGSVDGSLPGSGEGSLEGSGDGSSAGSIGSAIIPGLVVGGLIGSLVGSSDHGSSAPGSSTPGTPTPGTPSSPEQPGTPGTDTPTAPAQPAEPGQRGGQLAMTGTNGTLAVLAAAGILTLAGAALLLVRRRNN